MLKRIVSEVMLTLLLIGMLTFNISLLQFAGVEAEETMWWFDYTTMSVVWRADLAKGNFLVDFDGDHSTVALTDWGLWHVEWGTCSNLGVMKRFEVDGKSAWYAWAFRIGELKIGGPKAHINKADWWGNVTTEWFYFWVPKTTPPTDWVVHLQRSDGINPIPVTSTFWYSEDGGATWNSFTPVIPTIDIDPDTLNLKSNGKWITAYIELPEGYNIQDINASTIMLNDTISAEPRPIAVGDYDEDGITDLMVKFDRASVISYILANVNKAKLFEERFMRVTLTITGKLNDGTPFQGSDIITIVMSMPRAIYKIFLFPI